MRARFVNEIKQDKDSALSAIGIGKISLFPGWVLIKKEWPEFSDKFTDWETFIKTQDYFAPLSAEKFLRMNSLSVNNVVWANSEDLMDSISEGSEWSETPIQHTNDFVDIFTNTNNIIRLGSWVCYYNDDLKIGNIYNEDLPVGIDSVDYLFIVNN